MKLIEMEKVLSELCLSHKDIIYIDKNETAERIRKIPSIDIVFCKECKHWDRAIDESGTIERFNFSECTKEHYGNGLEFYCADGERREP